MGPGWVVIRLLCSKRPRARSPRLALYPQVPARSGTRLLLAACRLRTHTSRSPPGPPHMPAVPRVPLPAMSVTWDPEGAAPDLAVAPGTLRAAIPGSSATSPAGSRGAICPIVSVKFAKETVPSLSRGAEESHRSAGRGAARAGPIRLRGWTCGVLFPRRMPICSGACNTQQGVRRPTPSADIH